MRHSGRWYVVRDMTRLVLALTLVALFGCDRTDPAGGDAQDDDRAAARSEDTAKSEDAKAPEFRATGDAENITAEATAYWKPWGEDKPPLAVVKVLVKGEAPSKAIAFGSLVLDKATTDGGEAMKLYEGMRPDKDLRKTVSYRDLGWPGTKDEGVEFHLRFDHPRGGAKAIATLTGAIAVRVPGKEDALSFDDPAALIGKPLEHPALKAAGVELDVAWNDDKSKLEVHQRSGVLGQVGKVDLLKADGSRASESSSSGLSGPLPDYKFELGSRDDLAGTKLALTVYSDLQILRAPFTLTDVEIPARD